MNNYQLSQKGVLKSQDIDPLAIFFFFLGALHIYSALKSRARERQEEYENRYRSKNLITIGSYGRLALFALTLATIIEISLF